MRGANKRGYISFFIRAYSRHSRAKTLLFNPPRLVQRPTGAGGYIYLFSLLAPFASPLLDSPQPAGFLVNFLKGCE
jgi:hypothetical protein